MRFKFQRAFVFYFCVFFLIPLVINSQETNPDQISYKNKIYPLFPKTFETLPDVPSPFYAKDGMEVLLAYTKEGKYTLIPVTKVEYKSPLELVLVYLLITRIWNGVLVSLEFFTA